MKHLNLNTCYHEIVHSSQAFWWEHSIVLGNVQRLRAQAFLWGAGGRPLRPSEEGTIPGSMYIQKWPLKFMTTPRTCWSPVIAAGSQFSLSKREGRVWEASNIPLGKGRTLLSTAPQAQATVTCWTSVVLEEVFLKIFVVLGFEVLFLNEGFFYVYWAIYWAFSLCLKQQKTKKEFFLTHQPKIAR